MNILVTLISGLFTWLATLLARSLGIKLAINVAVFSLFIVFLAAFYTALVAILSGIAVTMPSVMSEGLSWLPSNFGACVSAVLSAESAAYIYRVSIIAVSVKSRL
ncbi:DUF5455 family protein [Pokkaliibacter sp. MBI-7]|uniref:DUF5455 family protein n=1 Tax=Pokkaliibacter sp. MBI-7 TaxID=3040600 RepID=UPI00244D1D27|nr:DUF5455 family protein [Pokkaliibacter sp. MBI-7]MDH2435390.1 DUF5455 family protein [Pokkaliibacter sp. MBI-7]MDH2435397.1 DUF5455 family protein [Pokkaliibacter sp. MBI-7]MDH2435404.1 DUF5455 family protein [Pokkaliibacter sp. MBI-7]